MSVPSGSIAALEALSSAEAMIATSLASIASAKQGFVARSSGIMTGPLYESLARAQQELRAAWAECNRLIRVFEDELSGEGDDDRVE